jgi:peptidoglycan-associated lipoprotein
MKFLAFSVLLAALLAGCAGTPSKEAAIEDRGTKAAEIKSTVAEKPLVTTTGKPGEAVVASGRSTQPVVAKSGEAVETRGVAAPGTEVKRLHDGKPAAAAGTEAGAVAQAGTDAKAGSDAKAGAAQDASTLPYSGGMSQADLKDPKSPLSKRRILFDYDSAAIRDEFRTLLEAHTQYMKTNKAAKAILQGHADERGSREYNLALGQRRAESVFKAMNLLGVPDAQMEAVSFGEEKPIAEGHDEAAWQQNRRTEILYQGE